VRRLTKISQEEFFGLLGKGGADGLDE